MADPLLPGEKEHANLRPHPLSFGGHYFLGAWPAILGGILLLTYRSAWWNGARDGSWYEFWRFLYGNLASGYVLMALGLVLVGIIAAVLLIRWSVAFAYAGVALATIALTATFWDGAARLEVGVPTVLAAFGGLGALGVEGRRRSHVYRITNLRILFSGGFWVKKERQVRYDHITDLDGTQSLLGRVLGFGTIIPVTASGFGLGEDTSQANVMAGGGAAKKGIFGGVAVGAGGGKGVNTGRARTFHQLTGVKPYKKTKRLLEELIQRATLSPYLAEQVDLQKEMLSTMREQVERMRDAQQPR